MEDVYRHGDVILQKINNIIPTMKKGKTLTLAEGEVTGHFHVLKGDLMFAEKDNEKFVEILSNTAILTHQEHDTLELPQGKYKYLIQREVDLSGEIKQVMD